MRIALTRASVSMGDDVAAPNAHAIEVPDDAPLEEIGRELMSSGWLPKLGNWWAELDGAALIMSWAGDEPFLCVVGAAPPRAGDLTQLHLHYRSAGDPDELCDTLRAKLGTGWPLASATPI